MLSDLGRFSRTSQSCNAVQSCTHSSFSTSMDHLLDSISINHASFADLQLKKCSETSLATRITAAKISQSRGVSITSCNSCNFSHFCRSFFRVIVGESLSGAPASPARVGALTPARHTHLPRLRQQHDDEPEHDEDGAADLKTGEVDVAEDGVNDCGERKKEQILGYIKFKHQSGQNASCFVSP